MNSGPIRYFFSSSCAAAFNSGVRSNASSSVTPCSVNAGGLVGNGCVGHACSPSTSLAGTGRSSIGQTGLPVTRSKTKANPCLVSCTTASMRPAVDADRDQVRRRRVVVVPQSVVDDLVVPLAHAGVRVEAHERFGEEVRAGTAAAVEIVARRAERHVDEPALGVERHRRPGVGVAGEAPRVVRPTCRCRTRPAAESCGTTTPACRCARRRRGCRPADRCGRRADRRRRCRGSRGPCRRPAATCSCSASC